MPFVINIYAGMNNAEPITALLPGLIIFRTSHTAP